MAALAVAAAAMRQGGVWRTVAAAAAAGGAARRSTAVAAAAQHAVLRPSAAAAAGVVRLVSCSVAAGGSAPAASATRASTAGVLASAQWRWQSAGDSRKAGVAVAAAAAAAVVAAGAAVVATEDASTSDNSNALPRPPVAQYGPAALLWRTVVPTLPPSPLTAPYVQHLSATFTVEEGANTPLLSHPLLENCATRGVFAVLGGASFPFVDARAPPYNRRNTPTPPTPRRRLRAGVCVWRRVCRPGHHGVAGRRARRARPVQGDGGAGGTWPRRPAAAATFLTSPPPPNPPHHPIPRAAAQLKDGVIQMKVRGLATAKNFAIMGGLFSSIECVIEKARGRKDTTNAVVTGALTGAILGARGGPRAIVMGAGGFAFFSVIMELLMPSFMGGGH